MTTVQRQRQIAIEATRLLVSLGVDIQKRIDVFGVARRLGLRVAFLPLNRLLGAYVSEGSAGVIVTTERPRTIQRYTAAHEIGHFRLHSEAFSLDSELEISGATPAPLEREAQLFASHLLMPLPLVRQLLREVGVRSGQVPTADQVYAIAGGMDVSYEAAVRQLQNIGDITRTHADMLLRYTRKSLRQSRTFGRELIPAGHHVWRLEEVEPMSGGEIYTGDVVAIAIDENRTTGRRWRARVIPYAPGTNQLETQAGTVVFDRFVPPATADDDAVIFGAPGTRQLVLRVDSAGTWELELVYAPAHRPGSADRRVVLPLSGRQLPAAENRTLMLEEFARGGE